MSKPRYKNNSMQLIYCGMLILASNTESELYHKGKPRRGASHRCAFWDGYNGMTRSANATPGTLGWACFQAGRKFAKQAAK